MWGEVTRGFAGVKLSGSPSRLGENRESVFSVNRRKMKLKISLWEK